MRFCDSLFRFSAVSRDFHLRGHDKEEALDMRVELHMLTGIGLFDARYWALET